MMKKALACGGLALLIGGCSNSNQPLQPSAALSTGAGLQQVLSNHKFDGQTAHVQFNTVVNGTIVAAAFFGNHIKDKSTVSGFNKIDDVIIGIGEQDAANPDIPLV